MESIVCVVCIFEISFHSFYNKYAECKQCKLEQSFRRYYEDKDKLSNQKKCIMRKIDVLLAKFKLNQQNRKTHSQQIEELTNKVEEVTRAMEVLILKIE